MWPQRPAQVRHHAPQFRDDLPGDEARFLFPCAVFGQVNGQHLRALGADDLSEGRTLFLAAVFAVDEQPDPVGRLAV